MSFPRGRLVEFLLWPWAAIQLACGVVDRGTHSTSAPVASSTLAITDGQPHPGYGAVGVLLLGNFQTCVDALNGVSLCSATVVGERAVLTAAHCLSGKMLGVFCLPHPHDGQWITYQLTKSLIHPSYRDDGRYEHDLGLIALADPAWDVIPAVISRAAPVVGQNVAIVGYGRTAADRHDEGVKRVAYNRIAQLEQSGQRFTVEGSGSGVGNLCFGDSGAPVFGMLDDRELQMGVGSAGPSGDCGQKTHVIRLDAYDAWLTEASEKLEIELFNGNSTGMFGTACTSAASCKSRLCAAIEGTRLCSEICDPSTHACPLDAACVELRANYSVCGPPHSAENIPSRADGACTYALAADQPTQGIHFLLLAVPMFRRLTRRRRSLQHRG